MAAALASVKIVGFFSLPPVSLAEHNPSAYTAAMAEAPCGSGTCSHCGNGIRHHVVIQDETGSRRFIGTDCAAKIGCDPECVSQRLTTEQRDARMAAAQAAKNERQQEIAEAVANETARLERRLDRVGWIVDILERAGSEFHLSLASQLRSRPLTYRQATFVAKLTSDTGRRNKKNADAWDEIISECTESECTGSEGE